jgi:pyruvate/2-oxoglutarate dehydrogenase complex dihydrolipoamide dehydrogenase (E3) component
MDDADPYDAVVIGGGKGGKTLAPKTDHDYRKQ